MWEKTQKRDATISTKDTKFQRFSDKMQSVNVYRVLHILQIIAVVTAIVGKLQPGECVKKCAERQDDKKDVTVKFAE